MAIGPKEAQRRALREMKFAQREKPIAKPKADRIAKAKAEVDNVVSHMANGGMANTSPAYKYRDADKRRSYQRALMRKKRAAEKHP